MAPKPSHDTLIHCDACGEDYSSTYRRCPFCGERNNPRRVSGRGDPVSSSRYIPTPPPAHPSRDRDEEELDDGYVFDGQDAFEDEEEESYDAPRPKGGKRLAQKQGGFAADLPPINWPRLITFLCSLIIIVAALVIVFTFIYPRLRGSKDSKPINSSAVSPSPAITDPIPSNSVDPNPVNSEDVVQTTDPVTAPPVDTAPVTTAPPAGGQPATIVNAAGGLRVRSGPGTSYNMVGSLYNGDSINVIAPSDNGWYQISLTGSGGSVVTGYIMGEYISTVNGATATTPAPVATNPPAVTTQPPASQSPVSPAVGRQATIVNAGGGLRVRSGPGTGYDIVASLFNGSSINVIAPSDNGWYQISFSTGGGSSMTGYIMGEYISTN